MECLQNRIDSFSKAKRVKNPTKSSSVVSLKWTHPPYPKFIATPETLAEAGFYFNPSYDDRDNVTCFMCEKQLAYWEAEDDPFDIHWGKCGNNCSWATVRCGLRGDMNHKNEFTFSDASRLPSSKIMEQARRDTFSVGDGWIHDQERNHGATSRKMALAGFVFTPQTPGDDSATCLYCHLALSGWDAEDDPTEEHRKRSKKFDQPCPFFSSVEPLPKPSSRSQAKAPSRSQQPPKHSRSASASKHKDLVVPMKTYDGEGSEDESDMPPASSRRSTTTKARPSKSAKKPKTHTRSQSRSGLKDVNEDVEDFEHDAEEETNDEVTAPVGRTKKKGSAPVTQKTRSRSKSVARRAANDDDEDMTITHKKPSRSKGPPSTEETEEEEEINVPSKSAKRTAPLRIVESDEDHGEPDNALKKSTRRKPSASVAKNAIPQKPSRTRKVKTPVESESQQESEMQGTEEEEHGGRKPRQPSGSKPKPLSTRTASRSKSKAENAPEKTTAGDEDNPSDEGPRVQKRVLSASKPNSVPTKARVGSTKTKGKTKAASRQIAQVEQDSADEQEGVELSHEGDEMDVLVPPHTAVKQRSEEHLKYDTWEEDEANPLYIPKRATKSTKPGHTPSLATQDTEAIAVRQEAKSQSKVPDKMVEEWRSPHMETTLVMGSAGEKAAIDEENKSPEPEKESNQISLPSERSMEPLVLANSRKPISMVPRSPSIPSLPSGVSNNVGVYDVEPVAQTWQGDNEFMTPQKALAPRTSPSSHAAPAPAPNTNGSSEPMSSTLPALSKLPFTPLQNLTDAELDMTVEDWIRYQMEVEYDKFRRDGEREVSRFKKRAEEVRSIIEQL